jgi:hypothetical protein
MAFFTPIQIGYFFTRFATQKIPCSLVVKGFKVVHVVCLWICVLIGNSEKAYQFG